MFKRYSYQLLGFTYHRTFPIITPLSFGALQESLSKLTQDQAKISQQCQHLQNTLQKPTIHTGGKFFMELSKGDGIVKDEQITEKFKALIKNLDEKSIAKVSRLVNRLKQNYLSNGSGYHISDQDEIAELNALAANFFPNIFELSKNVWCYDGYLLPVRHFEAGVFYFRHSLDILHPSTLAKMRQKDFIDVGGFIGDSAIIFEREFCDKTIHTFEATSANFKLLEQTLKLNQSTRIKPIRKGLGSKNELLHIGIGGSGSSIVYKGENTEQVQIITLDEYVRENDIQVGFIKVDIEGFEQEFLKGAMRTIREQKPAMLISIYHSFDDFFNIKPLIESWNLGYTFKIHRPSDFWNISIETALFCEVLE